MGDIKLKAQTILDSIVLLLILLIIVNLLGYALFKVAQPKCEPCLPGADCPPCHSTKQDVIQYGTILLDLFIIRRISRLTAKKIFKI